LADYDIPVELQYSQEDEWVRPDGDQWVVGVSDYAQDQLGDIVFVELPEVGAAVKRGGAFGVIESVKAVSDLFAPISGTVVAVNAELEDRPEIVNESCYGDGWLIRIEGVDPSEVAALLDANTYRKHVEERSE
jgi:glycine cleavage system H protein